jgi:DNA-binding MarR family transcriptional regulator
LSRRIKLGKAQLIDIVEELREKCLVQEEKIRRTLNLAETEYRGLLSFEGNERITCQEFSVRMNLSVSRGSRIIDRLYAEGYIDRADLSSDRRCKNIWLTKKGVVVRRRINEQRQFCEEKLSSDYSETKIKKLKKELRDLINKF